MIRRSTAARMLYLFLAAMQLSLPAVAAWADAASERENVANGPAVSHVEGSSDSTCPRIHPADCALCHAACGSFVRPTPSQLVASERRSAAPGRNLRRAHAPTDGLTWDARPRAPPALS